MNHPLRKFLATLLFFIASAHALAAPNVIVGTDTIVAGDSATISMTFQADGTVVAFDFRFTFDNTEFVATPACVGSLDTTGAADAPVICSVVGNEVRIFVQAAAGTPVPPITPGDRALGTVSFQSQGDTPPGVYNLVITQENYFDTDASPVTPTASTDGSITVQGPAAQFSPVPDTTLNLGSVQQGDTDPTTTVDVSNVGPTGTELDVSCVEFPASPAFSITNGVVNNLAPADSPHTVTVSCDSAQAPATYNGTMRCTHNGDDTGDASPADFPLTCTVTAGPSPEYGSSPGPGSTLNFGTVAKDSADPELSVDISNIGDPTTTLSGTCSIATNPNGAYAFTGGGGAYSVNEGAAPHTVTVACDTAVVGDHDGGVLSCTHNGTNIASPATYALDCFVEGEPAFTGTPNPSPLNLGPTPQNNTPPTGTLTITNTGDPDSVLDGSCALVSGTTPIEITSGGGVYSVTEGDPGHVVTVSCDTSNPPDDYNDTLRCSHDDPGQATPVDFPVSCTISQPDEAIYGSTPPSGSTIDITSGLDVVVGDPDPTAPLQIRNDASAGDADMEVTCGLVDVVGSAITVAPPVTNEIVAPGGDLNVTFTCDTSTANDPGTPFEANYSCHWFSVFVETPVGGADQPQTLAQESYTVTCEVRDPISDIDPSPPAGTTLTEAVEPGGSAQFQVVFNEVADEGIDGELNCALDSGADFTILSPDFSSPPVTVPAGGGVTVVVEGTDPGGVDSVQDILRCTYFDSANPNGIEVTYTLVLLIGGNASFTVDKVFTDGNPGEVLVTISCNTGLPLEQSKLISQGDGVKFIVGDFDTGEMDCSVTEAQVNGYSASYDASNSASNFEDSDPENPGCHYFEVTGGDDNFCIVTNTPDPVDVVITKEWVFEGSSVASGIDTRYDLTLFCDAEIVGGQQIGVSDQEAPEGFIGGFCGLVINQEAGQTQSANDWCKVFSGDGPETFVAEVIPEYPDSHCHLVERVLDNAVEVDNGCQDITVSAGQGDSCTVTNTVFFEGIPTLSQYGLAILALLMLGIGLVGFRRFA